MNPEGELPQEKKRGWFMKKREILGDDNKKFYSAESGQRQSSMIETVKKNQNIYISLIS